VGARQSSQPQQCLEEPSAEPSALNEGLTFMWTTPVLRHLLVEADGPHGGLLRVLEAVILRQYHAFALECTTQKGQTANDRFFADQVEVFESGGASFLEEEDGHGSQQAFATLRSAWLADAREYVVGAIGEEGAAGLFDDESSLRMFVWASVHEGCSAHVGHIHENTAVSGVFYLAVPPGSGPITFDDPRGLRPPFARNRLSHEPTAGELLLFPPWIGHSVAPSCAATSPRVALSFNIFTAGAEAENWELLADASFVGD